MCVCLCACGNASNSNFTVYFLLYFIQKRKSKSFVCRSSKDLTCNVTMLVSKDDSKFLLHLVIWLLFLFVRNRSIPLDMQPVYHPKMLAATSCGKNLYASQHSESPMSQKATITHLTEPSTSQIFYPPLPFQQAVVTAHLLPLSTQHSHRDGEILVVE